MHVGARENNWNKGLELRVKYPRFVFSKIMNFKQEDIRKSNE
jgi:hypothetical protein